MSTKSKRIKKNADILTDDDLKHENIKIRISMMIRLDLLEEIKKQADDCGKKYQTFLQELLADRFLNKKAPLEKRVLKLEKQLAALTHRKVG